MEGCSALQDGERLSSLRLKATSGPWQTELLPRGLLKMVLNSADNELRGLAPRLLSSLSSPLVMTPCSDRPCEPDVPSVLTQHHKPIRMFYSLEWLETG